ncbi:MAG: outer membrane protein assembly factor BamB [Panacagrimonas sp.]
MKQTHIVRAAFAVLVLGVAACSGKATVRKPSELQDIANPAIKPVTVWSAHAGDGAGGKVSGLRLNLQDDAIFVADIDGRVYALARDTGRTLWKVDTGSRVISGPGVSGDTVLVGTLDAEVIALKRADGSERWRKSVSSEVLGPPSGDGSMVVVRSIDGRIFGLNAGDGERVWSFDRGVPNLVLRGNSAPLVVGTQAIVGMDNGRVASLRLVDGQPQWEQAVTVPSGRTELERLTDIDADLLEVPECVLAASFGGEVACLAPDSGEALWRRSIRSYTGMAASAEKVFVTDDTGVVWGLDLRSGAAAWKQETLLYRKLSPPVYFGGYVVVGDFEGYLHWIDPADGKLVARMRAGSDPILLAPVATADRLFVMNAEGRIAAIQKNK